MSSFWRPATAVVETFPESLNGTCPGLETLLYLFTRGGEQVVLGARGSSITEVGGESIGGQIFNVFTLRDGRIVRIDDYRRRGEALTAAGVEGDAGWR